MRPLPTTLTALALVILPAVTRAEDVGAVAATLRDTASECRYFTQRCARCRAATKTSSQESRAIVAASTARREAIMNRLHSGQPVGAGDADVLANDLRSVEAS